MNYSKNNILMQKSTKEGKFESFSTIKNTREKKLNKIFHKNSYRKVRNNKKYNNKWKQKISYVSNISGKNNLITIIILLTLIFFPITLLTNINIRKLNLDSEITIVILGPGIQSILSEESIDFPEKSCLFDSLPTEIIVNDNPVVEISKRIYDLNEGKNTIIMKWNYEITNCCGMFYNLTNIIEIDLSKFDSSSVKDMRAMFQGCTSLTSLNLNSFNTSSVINMFSMFQDCENLISLDLSSFDTSLVKDIGKMFYNCKNLNNLDLKNFNTSSVLEMHNVFNGCYSLASLNLKSFDTSSVIEMSCMFYECRALTTLNLKNFNTSSITWMDSMFYGCRSLKSLNLKNFNTSLIAWMNGLFSECHSLEYLDISSFDTSKVIRMDAMFLNCRKLKYLNLYNFNTSQVTRMEDLFNGCSSLISLNLSSFSFSKVSDMNHMFSECKSLMSLNLINLDTSLIEEEIDIFNGCNKSLKYCIDERKASKIMSGLSEFNNSICNDICFIYLVSQLIPEKYSCIYLCNNDDEYKFEYKNVCYKSCPEGTHNSSEKEFLCEEDLICDNYYNYNQTDCIDKIPEGYYLNDSIQNTIDKCDIKCKSCSLESIQYNLCIDCNNNENYYAKYNDSSNNNLFINCYNEDFDGYYLNFNTKLYEP